MYYSITEITEAPLNPRIAPILLILLGLFVNLIGAGRGGRTPTTLRSADFESAASASSAIPAWGWEDAPKVSHRVWALRYLRALAGQSHERSKVSWLWFAPPPTGRVHSFGTAPRTSSGAIFVPPSGRKCEVRSTVARGLVFAPQPKQPVEESQS